MINTPYPIERVNRRKVIEDIKLLGYKMIAIFGCLLFALSFVK